MFDKPTERLSSHTQHGQKHDYLSELKKKYTQGHTNHNDHSITLDYTSRSPLKTTKNEPQPQHHNKSTSQLNSTHSTSCFRQKLNKIEQQYKILNKTQNSHTKSKSTVKQQSNYQLRIKKQINDHCKNGQYLSDNNNRVNQRQSKYNQQTIMVKLNMFRAKVEDDKKIIDSPIKLIYDDIDNQQNKKIELYKGPSQFKIKINKVKPEKEYSYLRQNVDKRLQQKNYQTHKPYQKEQSHKVIANIDAIMQNIRKTLRN